MSFFKVFNIVLICIVIGYALYQLYFFIQRKRAAEWIETEEFQKNMRTAQVIDVREKSEYDHGHIMGARSLPYTMAKAQKEYLNSIRKDKPVYLYDNKKIIAINMALLLKKNGYTDIRILKGGYMDWTGKIKKK